MRKVKIFLSRKDGTIHTDFVGFKGEACLIEAEQIFKGLADLGIKTSQKQFKEKPELKYEESDKDVLKH